MSSLDTVERFDPEENKWSMVSKDAYDDTENNDNYVGE